MPELAPMPELAIPVAADSAAAADERATHGAAIASVAMAVPDTVVPNQPIAERLGIAEEWIVKRTGVRERRRAQPSERLADFAVEAGRRALARAGVEATDLDLVLVATITPDAVAPNSAPVVAAELGATGSGALDLGAACNGFISGLALAGGQIEAGRAETVLVIGADLLSRITDPDDRSTATLLADGAGAAVLRETGARTRIGPTVLGSDGARADLITADRGGGLLRMNGHDTFKHAVARMSEATRAVLARAGRDLDDVDLFVYHQANSRIITAVGAELGLPVDRVVDYVPRFGNTSAGTIPIALALAEQEGRIADGALVLASAFGAGLAWGATLIEWGMGDA
jgi:3-oxoacyl-[acyl-carrier-protein] synthase III